MKHLNIKSDFEIGNIVRYRNDIAKIIKVTFEDNRNRSGEGGISFTYTLSNGRILRHCASFYTSNFGEGFTVLMSWQELFLDGSFTSRLNVPALEKVENSVKFIYD